MRITRFLRTIAYDQIFPATLLGHSGPTPLGDDGLMLVTKHLFRLLHPVNPGPGPRS